MKKEILTAALSLAISISVAAQENSQVQRQNKERTEKKEQTQNQEANKSAEQGQTVSTVARETPSGPGKGDVVSSQAKQKGESKKAEKQAIRETKKQKEFKKGDPGSAKQEQHAGPLDRNPDVVAERAVKGALKQGRPGKK